MLSVKIVDNDSKFNINRATPEILGQALTQIGVDASLVPTIRDSILDWRDTDSRELPNGAENDFYKRQVPPYLCKDAPIDDLSELLLVQGITPAMYWGSRISGAQRPVLNRPINARSALEETTYAIGFVDLFSAMSGGKITFGTAKPEAFLVLPFSEQEDGEAIVQARTAAYNDENPNPITDVNDPRLMLPEQTRLKLAGWIQQGYVGFKSLVFEATVTATIGGQSRTCVAMLRRNGPTDVQVLSFWWK